MKPNFAFFFVTAFNWTRSQITLLCFWDETKFSKSSLKLKLISHSRMFHWRVLNSSGYTFVMLVGHILLRWNLEVVLFGLFRSFFRRFFRRLGWIETARGLTIRDPMGFRRVDRFRRLVVCCIRWKEKVQVIVTVFNHPNIKHRCTVVSKLFWMKDNEAMVCNEWMKQWMNEATNNKWILTSICRHLPLHRLCSPSVSCKCLRVWRELSGLRRRLLLPRQEHWLVWQCLLPVLAEASSFSEESFSASIGSASPDVAALQCRWPGSRRRRRWTADPRGQSDPKRSMLWRLELYLQTEKNEIIIILTFISSCSSSYNYNI